MASQVVLPRAASPRLSEHKTCSSGGGKLDPPLRSKSTSSFLIRVASFSILGKKVGKVLILEKRKTGKLELREHNTEVRCSCRQREVKIKS